MCVCVRVCATPFQPWQLRVSTSFSLSFSAPRIFLCRFVYFFRSLLFPPLLFAACRIKVENFYCCNYAYRLPNIISKYYFDSRLQETHKKLATTGVCVADRTVLDMATCRFQFGLSWRPPFGLGSSWQSAIYAFNGISQQSWAINIEGDIIGRSTFRVPAEDDEIIVSYKAALECKADLTQQIIAINLVSHY